MLVCGLRRRNVRDAKTLAIQSHPEFCIFRNTKVWVERTRIQYPLPPDTKIAGHNVVVLPIPSGLENLLREKKALLLRNRVSA